MSVLFEYGCMIKYGIYNIKNSQAKDLVGGNKYIAVEIGHKFFDNKMGLSLGFGSLIDTKAVGHLETTLGGTAERQISFYDIYSTAYFFPFNTKNKSIIYIEPFIGAGLSYYNLRWEINTRALIFVPI